MNTIITCPYCGFNAKIIENSNHYHCTECDSYFDEDDIEFETCKHQISALLMDTSEYNPKPLNVVIGEEEAMGLNTLELPLVTSAFQDPEGISWFNIYGMILPLEADDLSITDLRTILKELQKQ